MKTRCKKRVRHSTCGPRGCETWPMSAARNEPVASSWPRTLLLLFVLSVLSCPAQGQSRNSSRTPGRCEKDEKRSYLDSCLKQLPPMLTQAQSTGLPKSKHEVETLCTAFKTGMKCVDEYAEACLGPNERRILEEHVAGARHTFRFLCDDRQFQAEYLQHTSCYRGMSKDWDSCSDRFMSIVNEETARRNVSMHTRRIGLCCAKFGFLRCIFVTSRYKCKHEAAVFLHRIADTLANVQVYTPQCQGVSEAVCSARAAPRHSSSSFLFTLVFLFVVKWQAENVCS